MYNNNSEIQATVLVCMSMGQNPAIKFATTQQTDANEWIYYEWTNYEVNNSQNAIAKKCN